MKHVSLTIIVAALCCACNVSISHPDDNNQNVNNGNDTLLELRLNAKQQQQVVQGNEFTLNMLRQTYANRETENVIISPLSLSMALSILMNGAEGETLQQLKDGLGFGEWSNEEINRYNQLLLYTLPKLDNYTKVMLANSLWVANGFPIKEDFVNTNKLYFQSKVRNVDFSDPATAVLINAWAAEHTNDLIKEIVDAGLIYDCVALIANALYFKGIWAEEFKAEDTKPDAKFLASDKSTQKVEMMYKHAEMKYALYNKAQLAELDYKGDAYCMDLLLPPADMDIMTFLKSMQAEDIMNFEQNYWPEKTYGNTTYRNLENVDLYMPKFRLHYERMLNNDLMALGMTNMFSPSADFSRLSNIATHVSFVKQNTFLSVDETGTEAAAVTVIGVKETAAMPTMMELNRPFVLFIREKKYGTILFAAVIGNPNEK